MDIDISKLTVEEIIDLKAKLAAIKIAVCRPAKEVKDYPEFNWDWTKTNSELATIYGVPYSRIAYLRRRLGKPQATKFYPACEAWDWTKPDAEIAREHKCDIGTVRHWRNSLGKPDVARVDSVAHSKTNSELKRELWESLDWSKPDVFLSREVGVTRERIRQIRALLGKPRLTKNDFKKKQFLEAVNGVKQISGYELNEKVPFLNQTTARKWCRESGIAVITDRSRVIKKHPWHKLNLNIPNILLSEIWRIPTGQISRHRYEFQLGKPAFFLRNGRIPEAFAKMIEDERVKASEHFAEKNGGQ